MCWPALGVGALMVLTNADAFAAPRLLGPAAADAYAVAALPARGVFFALFAVSWLAVPVAARAVRRGQLIVPIGGVLALGAAAGLTLLTVRPLLPIALGDPAPAAGLMATLVAAMAVAAAVATALAMAVAPRRHASALPIAASALALVLTIAVARPHAAALAGLVLGAATISLVAVVAGLLRTVPAAVSATSPPLLAQR